MQYIAEAKNVKMSPRKVRLVADSVRRQSVAAALSKLMVLNKRAAQPVRKVIESAIANAVHNFKGDKNNLVIKELTVQEGGAFKRYHFAARGRTRPYKRRMSHIRVVLADKEEKVSKSEARSSKSLPAGRQGETKIGNQEKEEKRKEATRV